METRLIAKNMSIPLKDSDIVLTTNISAKNVWSTVGGSLGNRFGYRVKALIIRGNNSTAGGYVQLHYRGDMGGTKSTQGNFPFSIFGSDVDVMIDEKAFGYWPHFFEVNKKIKDGGSFEVIINSGSTWTGVLNVSVVFTRDHLDEE